MFLQISQNIHEQVWSLTFLFTLDEILCDIFINLIKFHDLIFNLFLNLLKKGLFGLTEHDILSILLGSTLSSLVRLISIDSIGKISRCKDRWNDGTVFLFDGSIFTFLYGCQMQVIFQFQTIYRLFGRYLGDFLWFFYRAER